MIIPSTTLKEIKGNKVLGELFPYFIYESSGTSAGNLKEDRVTLADIQTKNPTWSARDMAFGLNGLLEQEGHPVLISVDGSADGVAKLIFFKADEAKRQNKTVVLAAGGAYGAVCSLVEAFPVARLLAQNGVDAFCLNYHVGAPAPLFPRPMEDMALAVKHLFCHQKELDICMNNYAVGGFSAGGHLAATFGTKEQGYARYNLPKPNLLMLAYPMTDIWGNISPLPGPVKNIMLGGYFGKDYTQEMVDAYNVTKLADAQYPTCFVVQAQDDTTVPIAFTEKFVDKLAQCEVPVRFLRAKTGAHGFGLGTECDAAGWVLKALDFWNEQSMGTNN